MDKRHAFEKLHSIGQGHLIQDYDQLSKHQQQGLLEQIERLQIPVFRKQQLLLMPTPHSPIRFLDPVLNSAAYGENSWSEQGKGAIKQGLVGALLIAGGQGSRLRFNGPKGCFPVSVIKKKSLFQLFAEKTLAASIQANRPLPLAIMTSPLNTQATISYFENHRYFGLEASQVSFFAQELLPFLDDQGNLVPDPMGNIAEGPDGNGSCLRNFFDSGIWDIWYGSGVRLVNSVLIDNPLADPFDAELIGYHLDENADVVIKCTTREDPKEKVGLIAKHNDRIEIVEYTEVPEEVRNKKNDQGGLLYNLANLSLFSFSMDFIKSAAHKDLPLHRARKSAPTAKDPSPEKPNIWKFETFIFDTLQYATKIKTLIYPRDSSFSPLKNRNGRDSLETVQQALLQRDRKIFQQITGTKPPDKPFELSQQFYYPTQEFAAQWAGKSFPNAGYIE
ncbi:putative UDP-N-acetylglucosamine pyrophosphorylase [Waddlia chondrophila 2032/99]|uniref:UDP-glucose pyrophosphorylase n=2 Tax=Waddlia chondrophila TaxID=71667 RepID=D6YST5_WADCW|nr:UTP--glucose-1-phosphate uridylyltransferase [Waddlia chondrophila]ADI39130.1 UDP-glucose pyrophosphorylase [Waddlia chondrophila WSU 86-1044]CCB92243.1 putative UDP-N-acetylglucosamine pyrophosphorylase [Waddlia chondrophila 2032/99]